jgi:two-component system, response regulator PdtaR
VPQQVSETSTDSTPAPSADGLRVLVVEDEALIRLDLTEMLTEEGYVVAGEAADGEQAIELARSLRPDLVIMDVKMPKVDGIAAAASIVGERIAPVVMLTAFSQRDLIEQARDAGALAYLVKPFERSELVPAVEVALGRFKEIRALHDQTASLEEQFETRKVVDRAKGKLMDEFGLNENSAFAFIQKRAMSERVTMRAISQRVIDGDLKPDA